MYSFVSDFCTREPEPGQASGRRFLAVFSGFWAGGAFQTEGPVCKKKHDG